MPTTKERSMPIEFKKAEEIVAAVKALLARHAYPDDERTVLAIAFVDQIIEHHAALLLLLRSQMIGSAFALLRSIFEILYHGLWFNLCATEEQVRHLAQKDYLNVGMKTIAEAIDKAYATDSFFSDLKKRSWDPLNSYAHTGLLQLGRRFTGHELRPSYQEQEIVEAVRTATASVLLLIRPFFVVQGHEDEAKGIDILMDSFGATDAAIAPGS